MRLPGIPIIGVLVLVVSCTVVDESLSGTSWTLAALGPVSAPQPALEGSGAALSFSEEGNEVTEDTGCNSYWGSYEADGESFTIAELSWHERGCPSDGLFQQESAMIDILVGAHRYSSSDSRLTIESADGRALVFKR
ncbi:MAG: META domain-containing protein [Chloroflexota bacterium]|nr:META domain-containing protein [Chloroflexota bacterium]